MVDVPAGDIVAVRIPAGVNKHPTNIDVPILSHSDGIDGAVQSGVESVPGGAIPARDIVSVGVPTGIDERATSVDVAVPGDRDGIDGAIQSGAKGVPGSAVPAAPRSGG